MKNLTNEDDPCEGYFYFVIDELTAINIPKTPLIGYVDEIVLRAVWENVYWHLYFNTYTLKEATNKKKRNRK